MDLKGKKINFLGDSITFGFGLMDLPELPEDFDPATLAPEDNPILNTDPDTLEGSFVNVLRNECGLAAARNYGICGSRIARQQDDGRLDLFPDTFCDRADRMDPDADIIVVFGGTNDFGHGNAPLGMMADRTDASFFGALHVLCRKLIRKYPASEIVLWTRSRRRSRAAGRSSCARRCTVSMRKALWEKVKSLCRRLPLSNMSVP